MQTLPIQTQTMKPLTKEKPNETLILCSRRTLLRKTGAGALKGRLTVRYRFCYTLDMWIAQRIVSQRGCSRSQRNPLINDRWEANKHQPSSYPMVI